MSHQQLPSQSREIVKYGQETYDGQILGAVESKQVLPSAQFSKIVKHGQESHDAHSFGMVKYREKDGEASDTHYNHLLFVGNPGVGKSTLLNCYVKYFHPDFEDYFHSGISLGIGLTEVLDIRQIGCNKYLDTPGLEDAEQRERAAKEITKSLKKDGDYRVIFVVTLDNGRVRTIDKTTIKLILDSAKEITKYGIIFNQLTEKVLTLIRNNKAGREKVIAMLAPKYEDRSPPFTFFLPEVERLESQENHTVMIEGLDDFINSVPVIKIRRSEVDDIPVNTFEEQLHNMENENQRLEKDVKMLKKYCEENERRTRELIAIEKKKIRKRTKRIFRKDNEDVRRGKKKIARKIRQRHLKHERNDQKARF